jgi:hypothetical protein
MNTYVRVCVVFATDQLVTMLSTVVLLWYENQMITWSKGISYYKLVTER